MYGAVYDVVAEEVPRLDEAEGLGCGYDKAHMTLAGYGEVFLYLAAASHIDETLLPLQWYKDYVVAGAKHHSFPKEYINALTRVAVQTG